MPAKFLRGYIQPADEQRRGRRVRRQQEGRPILPSFRSLRRVRLHKRVLRRSNAYSSFLLITLSRELLLANVNDRHALQKRSLVLKLLPHERFHVN